MSGLLRFILGGDPFVRPTDLNPFGLRYRRIGLNLSKPVTPQPSGLSLSKPWLDIGSAFSSDSEAALSPRQATHFLLLRQKKVSQEKASLVPASVRFAAGTLRYTAQPGSRSNSAIASDNRGPLSVWASAPRRIHKGLGDGVRFGFGSVSRFSSATIFIAACACISWARVQKHSPNRRASWFWGSDRNFAAKHPKGAPQARRIWALTPKTPGSESAHDSLPQTPCGRAEQRRMGRKKILDVRRPRSGLVSKISASAEQRKESRSDPDFGSPFFGLPYFGEAKKGKSPAAATERHRIHTQTRCSIQVKASTGSARPAKRKHQSPTPC
jgi:hypothetical protein